ncbi:ankyrin repeat domain-containing protein 40 [Rhincodon typus]|uniref:ankyrin repeat domain-containing protein 40 n=1 Tax=Rhincodon typus TaxID=259920 RepID=UPI00202E4B29|nr:ankyrin repeat domain-containing protein 40 [Rhincodon typus]
MLGVDEDSEPVVNGESALPFLPNYLANPSFPYVEKRESKSSQAPAVSSLTGRKPSLTSQPQNGPPAGPPATFQPLFFTGAYPINEQELVLKVRIQNPAIRDSDFIEVELNRQELTYQALLRVSCQELGIDPEQVAKIRKLPNTLLRKCSHEAQSWWNSISPFEKALQCLPDSTFSSTASDYNLSFHFSEQQLLDKEVARLQNFQELEFVLQKGDPTLSSVPVTLTERPCYNQGAATLTY